MRIRNKSWYFLQVVIVFVLILNNSCKKNNDKPTGEDPFKVIAITSLTDTNQSFESPVFSPDGHKIAFPSIERDLNGWKAVSVKIINPDGTSLTELASVSAYKSPVPYSKLHRSVSLCWSPDGTKILFTVPTEEYGCHLFLINADGSGLTQVTENIKAYDFEVSWSR